MANPSILDLRPPLSSALASSSRLEVIALNVVSAESDIKDFDGEDDSD